MQRHLKKELDDLPETSLRKYKTLYTKELTVYDKGNDTSDITALVQRKRERPLSLGVNLNTEVQKYVLALQHIGTPVTGHLLLAAGEGIITTTVGSLLAENGGHITLSRGWAAFVIKH